MKADIMKTQELVSDNNLSKKAPNGFQHTVDKFLLCFPCIITIDNIVNVGGIYDLIDFLDNAEIVATKIRFLDAYQTGYNITIVVLDTKTGEMLKRSHHIDNDSLACDWVLTDYFNSENRNDELLEFGF